MRLRSQYGISETVQRTSYSNANVPDSRQSVGFLWVEILDDSLLSELLWFFLRFLETASD